MRHASGHDYSNSLFIVDVAMGQIPRSTERISSFVDNSVLFPTMKELSKWLTVDDGQGHSVK